MAHKKKNEINSNTKYLFDIPFSSLRQCDQEEGRSQRTFDILTSRKETFPIVVRGCQCRVYLGYVRTSLIPR